MWRHLNNWSMFLFSQGPATMLAFYLKALTEVPGFQLSNHGCRKHWALTHMSTCKVTQVDPQLYIRKDIGSTLREALAINLDGKIQIRNQTTHWQCVSTLRAHPSGQQSSYEVLISATQEINNLQAEQSCFHKILLDNDFAKLSFMQPSVEHRPLFKALKQAHQLFDTFERSKKWQASA